MCLSLWPDLSSSPAIMRRESMSGRRSANARKSLSRAVSKCSLDINFDTDRFMALQEKSTMLNMAGLFTLLELTPELYR